MTSSNLYNKIFKGVNKMQVKELIESCQNTWSNELWGEDPKFEITFKFLNNKKIEKMTLKQFYEQEDWTRHYQQVEAWKMKNLRSIEIIIYFF